MLGRDASRGGVAKKKKEKARSEPQTQIFL